MAIVLIIGAVAIGIVVAIVIRSIFYDDVDPDHILAIWNPLVALLGGLVGYVAGQNSGGNDGND